MLLRRFLNLVAVGVKIGDNEDAKLLVQIDAVLHELKHEFLVDPIRPLAGKRQKGDMKHMRKALEVGVIGFFLAREDDVRVGTVGEDRFAELALHGDKVEIRIAKALLAHKLAK